MELQIQFIRLLSPMLPAAVVASSRRLPKPASGRIAVKVIKHLGDQVMKVYRV